jgi:C4-dicarboxylate-specific signal transduction histidine kinase/CheY-like chemotaxis protein
MKPKPLSVQHRFILLQASSFALALWFLAGAIYLNLKIRHEMEEPLQDLRAALALNFEIEASQEQVMMAAATAHLHPGEQNSQEFQAAARRLPELAARYLTLPVSPQERRVLETIRELQSRLIVNASQDLKSVPQLPVVIAQVQELLRMNVAIELLLHSIAQAHLQQLETTTARLGEYTRTLYLLLAGFGLFTILALLQFRRVHREEIWQPLEDLRRMVMQVRSGNLDLTGTAPRSIEFGPLVQGFLDMAGDLREMRDGLEQKVHERTTALKTVQDDLVQAAKLSALGQLISGVAHEINNPLTSILGFSELILSRPELDLRLKLQVQTIREEALRLRTLVTNLSAYARRGPQRTTQFDLRGVLDRIAALRGYQLSASNIVLHLDRPDAPVWVEGDLDRLLQVFFNLVLNAEQAIQVCRTKGDIWLACGEDHGRVWATVRDNGCGMSPAVKSCIFDPFFTTKPVGQGAGLGLSISHGIIQQHHGSIAVESAEGQGTTIRISIPLAQPPSKPPFNTPAKRPATRPGGASSRNTLIIDDEPAITQLLDRFLADRGWRCTVLNDVSGLDACLQGRQFDLVICDLKMPGRNGLEVLRLLQVRRPELARRFLLITGNLSDAEQHVSGDELAGVPVLRKPFTLESLEEALAGLTTEQE